MWTSNNKINTEYISSIMNQDAIKGSTEEITAKYLALIRTFENIEDKENMENFLNSCYRITEKELPKTLDYKSDMMDAYKYFKDENDVRRHCKMLSLSPVFKEMTHYYSNYVLPEQLNKISFNSGLSQNEIQQMKNKILHGGILQNTAKYGDIILELGENEALKRKVIDISLWDEDTNKINMVINKNIDIVQYQYTDEHSNVWNAVDITKDYLESCKTTLLSFTKDKVNGYVIDKTVEGCIAVSGGAAPYVAGGAAALSLICEIGSAMENNEDIDNASSSLDFAAYTAALGIEGQMYSVNGKAGYQFMTVDIETLAINLGAYNCYAKTPLTLQDLMNSDKLDAVRSFKIFYCQNCEEGREIDQYKQELGDKDPTSIFSKEDKKILTETINERWGK